MGHRISLTTISFIWGMWIGHRAFGSFDAAVIVAFALALVVDIRSILMLQSGATK